jgi:LysM repeat protein
MRRLLVSVVAFVALVAALAGLPYVLIRVAGNPLPRHVPAPDEIWAAITRPDNGSLFLTALTIVAWLAWATFVLSVLVEIPAQLRGRRTARLPGLSAQQKVAALLVGALLAIVLTPGFAAASVSKPIGVGPLPASTVVAVAEYVHTGPHTVMSESPASTTVRATQPSVTHTVVVGESLLSIAEHYGVSWEALAQANYSVTQPDGRSLQPGEQRIYPGWTLTIPQVGSAHAVLVAVQQQDQQVYEVVHGDWLGFIAQRYLGDFNRYPEIAALNAHIISNPDHIEPTWRLTLPAGAYDHGERRHSTGSIVVPASSTPPATSPTPQTPQSPSAPTAPSGVTSGVVGAGGAVGAASGGGVASVPTAVPAPSAVPEATPGAAVPTPTATAASPTPAATHTATAPTDLAAGSAVSTRDGEPQVGSHAGASAEAESDEGSVKVAGALAAAGLLAALTLATVINHRRRQRQHHQAGYRMQNPQAGQIETELRVAALPANVERFDAALRSLAASLAELGGPLPDPIGALLSEEHVRLLLAAGCQDPPTPWEDHGDSWLLHDHMAVVADRAQIAPFPSMAAIGGVDATHLLLDLERVGMLVLTGEPQRRSDLIRYIASELALNSWCDDVEVLLAGFNVREAELLVALNPDRVRVVRSVTDAAERLTRRTTTAIATLEHAGVPDALAGRVSDVAADSWMPQILLVNEPDATGIAILGDLIVEMDNGGRCAVGVVVTAPPEVPPFGRWSISVAADATLHLPFPLPYPPLVAAGLSMRELERLAEMMRAARDRTEMIIPPAPEPDAWAEGTDAAGGLLDMFEEPTEEIPLIREAYMDIDPPKLYPDDGAAHAVDEYRQAPPDRWHSANIKVVATELPRPPTVTVSIHDSPPDGDPELDGDLASWRDHDPTRPHIAILGPVEVDAPGPALEHRRRFHAEIIVYLAQRAGRGADRDQLDSALWPGRDVKDASRRVAITRARRWLGDTPSGEPWLPDMDVDRLYRLTPGYLFDWHLFRRLRTRAGVRGAQGAGDLRAALELVRGVPVDEADRPFVAGARAPYPWLAESDIHPDHITSAIVDTAHELAALCLDADDTVGVRWAVRQAWLADPHRSYDQPWRDLMLAHEHDGHPDQVRATFGELMVLREAEVPEDLSPDTYQLVLSLIPELAREDTMAH